MTFISLRFLIGNLCQDKMRPYVLQSFMFPPTMMKVHNILKGEYEELPQFRNVSKGKPGIYKLFLYSPSLCKIVFTEAIFQTIHYSSFHLCTGGTQGQIKCIFNAYFQHHKCGVKITLYLHYQPFTCT